MKIAEEEEMKEKRDTIKGTKEVWNASSKSEILKNITYGLGTYYKTCDVGGAVGSISAIVSVSVIILCLQAKEQHLSSTVESISQYKEERKRQSAAKRWVFL